MAKQIRQLPIAPDSANPATFNTRADAFVKAMQPFADDANALARELEEFSVNVDTKSGDTDIKYTDLVKKYNDFIAKYADFFAKYDIFVPAYLDVKKKHGEVRTNKEHVDEVKRQIDAALKKATDMINEGGIIDDTKTTLVTTYSSMEIQRRLDLKADDATAYREWNYKEISDDFAAQNNDALFINTTKPITITLPSEGKIKIVDKVGNLSAHNVKLIDGVDIFVLNKDFQRVELFKFEGKWRVVSGYLLKQVVGHEFEPKKLLDVSRGHMSGRYFISATDYTYSVKDIFTGEEKAVALPAPTGHTLSSVRTVKNGVVASYYLFKDSKFEHKIFLFSVDTMSFKEIPSAEFNKKTAGRSATGGLIFDPNLGTEYALFLVESGYGGVKIPLILFFDGSVLLAPEGQTNPRAWGNFIVISSSYGPVSLYDVVAKQPIGIQPSLQRIDRVNKTIHILREESREYVKLDYANGTYEKTTISPEKAAEIKNMQDVYYAPKLQIGAKKDATLEAVGDGIKVSYFSYIGGRKTKIEKEILPKNSQAKGVEAVGKIEGKDIFYGVDYMGDPKWVIDATEKQTIEEMEV